MDPVFGVAPALGVTDARLTRRLIVKVTLRVIGILGLTLLLYSMLPVERGTGALAAGLIAGLGILIILVVYAWQLRRVARAERPTLAAIEAVSLVFGLFVCFFALLYVALSIANPQAFTEQLSRASGLYFTVTVLATVGFGDIAPATDAARIAVTIQMVLGLTLFGTALRALGASAKSAKQARASQSHGSQSQSAAARRPGSSDE